MIVVNSIFYSIQLDIYSGLSYLFVLGSYRINFNSNKNETLVTKYALTQVSTIVQVNLTHELVQSGLLFIYRAMISRVS